MENSSYSNVEEMWDESLNREMEGMNGREKIDCLFEIIASCDRENPASDEDKFELLGSLSYGLVKAREKNSQKNKISNYLVGIPALYLVGRGIADYFGVGEIFQDSIGFLDYLSIPILGISAFAKYNHIIEKRDLSFVESRLKKLDFDLKINRLENKLRAD